MRKVFLMPLWVLAASLWLRREQTVIQRTEEETSDLRHYIERLDALYHHTPLPRNRFEKWLCERILVWIQNEKGLARRLILGKLVVAGSSNGRS